MDILHIPCRKILDGKILFRMSFRMEPVRQMDIDDDHNDTRLIVISRPLPSTTSSSETVGFSCNGVNESHRRSYNAQDDLHSNVYKSTTPVKKNVQEPVENPNLGDAASDEEYCNKAYELIRSMEVNPGRYEARSVLVWDLEQEDTKPEPVDECEEGDASTSTAIPGTRVMNGTSASGSSHYISSGNESGSPFTEPDNVLTARMQPGQIVVQRFRAGVLVQDMDRRGILVQRTYSCKYPSVQLLPGQRLFEFRIHGRRLFQVIRPGQTLKQRISYGQVLFQMYLPSPGNDYDVFNGKRFFPNVDLPTPTRVAVPAVAGAIAGQPDDFTMQLLSELFPRTSDSSGPEIQLPSPRETRIEAESKARGSTPWLFLRQDTCIEVPRDDTTTAAEKVPNEPTCVRATDSFEIDTSNRYIDEERTAGVNKQQGVDVGNEFFTTEVNTGCKEAITKQVTERIISKEISAIQPTSLATSSTSDEHECSQQYGPAERSCSVAIGTIVNKIPLRDGSLDKVNQLKAHGPSNIGKDVPSAKGFPAESMTRSPRIRKLSERGVKEQAYPVFDAKLKKIWTFDGFYPIQSVNRSAGLRNLGQTCFINSVLQCLLHLPPFTRYIMEVHKHAARPSETCFACLLKDNFLEIVSGAQPNAARHLINRWTCLFGKRYQMMQEDAHEFLITLINKMNVEFSKYFIYEGGLMVPSPPLEQIFFGKTRTIMECKCGEFRARYEQFFDLNLPIPRNVKYGTQISITNLLELFVKKEQVDHKCSKCKKNMYHSTYIYKCPSILVLQILCFDLSGQKIQKQINVEKIISLKDFTYLKDDDEPYELMSVIYHEGVINDGHYTALVKGFDKKFYYYNDEEVRPSNGHINITPYLAIYRRQNQSGRVYASSNVSLRSRDDVVKGILQPNCIRQPEVHLSKSDDNQEKSYSNQSRFPNVTSSNNSSKRFDSCSSNYRNSYSRPRENFHTNGHGYRHNGRNRSNYEDRHGRDYSSGSSKFPKKRSMEPTSAHGCKKRMDNNYWKKHRRD